MLQTTRFCIALICSIGLGACDDGRSTAPFAPGDETDPRDERTDEAEPDAASDEPSDAENPLLGTWEHDVGAGCSYTHSFDDEGLYRQVATTGEVVDGEYELTAPEEPGERWMFSFTIIADNNVVDCEGMQNHEVGDAHSALLEFVGDHSVNVYRGSAGSPAFTWTRR